MTAYDPDALAELLKAAQPIDKPDVMLSDAEGGDMDEIMAADATWFALHPDKTERIRPIAQGDLPAVGDIEGFDAAGVTHVRVVSVAPGVRIRYFGGLASCDIDTPTRHTPVARRP